MNIRLVSYFHFSGRGPHFRTSRPLRIPPAGETGPGPAARRPLFRSTYFPPSDKLLKGSGLDLLADEIESIVYSKP